MNCKNIFPLLATILLIAFSQQGFSADTTVYLEKNGIVVAEAEDLVYNDKWKFANTPTGFTGRGAVQYIGPVMGEGDPEAHDIDMACAYQGKPEDRLVMWVKISTTGTYSVIYNTYHVQTDGDNDAWVSQMDKPCEATRFGTWGYDAKKWIWCGFCGTIGNNNSHPATNSTPCHPMQLEAGKVYGIYAAGRSTGYYLDRVVLFLWSAKDAAFNVNTPVSQTINSTPTLLPKSTKKPSSFSLISTSIGIEIAGVSSVEMFNLKGGRVGVYQNFIPNGTLPRGLYMARSVHDGLKMQAIVSILK